MKSFLLKHLKNKFVLVTLVFIVWVGFIDDKYNIIRQFQLSSTLNNLSDDKKNYESIIESNSFMLNKLETDIHFVEKYGRETYFIRKDDEVVYYIPPKE